MRAATLRVRLGQLFFSVMNHRLYDRGLYGLVTGRIWRCPTERLLDNYADNISHSHLEIGVGSGYFLERTLCADFIRRLVLLDLNRRGLMQAAARLRAYAPQVWHQNIDQPLPTGSGFLSVGMNYVLHCIPGTFRSNRRLFGNVHSALHKGGVFFGATLVRHSFRRAPWSWLMMRLLNLVGIFNNTLHSASELKEVMESLFREVEISMVGSAAVFRAVK